MECQQFEYNEYKLCPVLRMAIMRKVTLFLFVKKESNHHIFILFFFFLN